MSDTSTIGMLTSLEEAQSLDATLALPALMQRAATLRDAGFPATLNYSRKVFIPLTRLCRDVCHYCTFATTPSDLPAAYLSLEEVLDIARRGQAAGCREALFTLGDRPETRYAAAREWLARHGYASTVDYLEAAAGAVLRETGLLPHINAGVLTEEEYRRLRKVSPSMGLMLESTSQRLCERGGAHFGSPDKQPAVRLASLEAAGRAQVPLTTGLLVGIGETRRDRLESLFALRELHQRHGHLQEIILQNFVAKADTPMRAVPSAELDELCWTIAMARLIFGPDMSLQAPPNLNAGQLTALIDAGINDWGGVSPVTPDHVNPESPWPQLASLAHSCAERGRSLVARLTVYPSFIAARELWIDADLRAKVLAHSYAEGMARSDEWLAGATPAPPSARVARGCEPVAAPAPPQAGPTTSAANNAGVRGATAGITALLARAQSGSRLSEREITRLFAARGAEVDEICASADALRQQTRGDVVTYVVNRNINSTNVCLYKCGFCAFSKGRTAEHLRGKAYVLELDEVAERAVEAWQRGATEVCMQGGIHPSFTGQTYLDLLGAVKRAVPAMHVHAFSPLEVQHGAETLGLPIEDFLAMLRDAGLGSLPGTAAEILDDPIRDILCPDKLRTQQWLDVIGAAHRVGLPTTATIMFGSVETPVSWARHLLAIRDQQERSGGFTEFVPLSFVHMEAPLHRRGRARPGPTWREVLLMHAIARLSLHPLITSVQASWVKLGTAGAGALLRSGVNDLGGVLMNESISRAAGSAHGQEITAGDMAELAASFGRHAQQRSTLYKPVDRPDLVQMPALAANNAAFPGPQQVHPRHL